MDSNDPALISQLVSPKETLEPGLNGICTNSEIAVAGGLNRRLIVAISPTIASGGPFTASPCECVLNHESRCSTETHGQTRELCWERRGEGWRIRQIWLICLLSAAERESKRHGEVCFASIRTYRSLPSVCNTNGIKDWYGDWSLPLGTGRRALNMDKPLPTE